MTTGQTVLCMKDPGKGNAVDNYGPISCLPVMWKVFSGMLAEEIYEHLEGKNLFQHEQKGCKKKSSGTKDQLLIDKTILRNRKNRKVNLAMAWIDYRKAYDMIPHSWILQCMRLTGVSENIMQMVENSMQNWKTTFTSAGKELPEVPIRRSFFQGDSLSSLLFVICLIPMSLVLRKVKAGYSFANDKPKVNYLLFMDDMKLFGRSFVEIGKLVRTVYLVSADMRMEFGIRKCGVLVLKKGKFVDSDGVQLPKGERMQSVEEEGHKCLGILEVDDLQHTVMKERFCAEYFRRLKNVLSSKLNGRNVIRAINAWAVAVMRYGAGVVNWTQTEIQATDRKTRKKLSMYGAMYVWNSVDRLYCSRRKGGRGMRGVCACVKVDENSLAYYVPQTLEPVLQEVDRQNIVHVVQFIEPSDHKEAEKLKGMQNWKKQSHARPVCARYRTCCRQGEVFRVVSEWRPEKGDRRHDTGSPGTGFEDQLHEVQDRSQLCFPKM